MCDGSALLPSRLIAGDVGEVLGTGACPVKPWPDLPGGFGGTMCFAIFVLLLCVANVRRLTSMPCEMGASTTVMPEGQTRRLAAGGPDNQVPFG